MKCCGQGELCFDSNGSAPGGNTCCSARELSFSATDAVGRHRFSAASTRQHQSGLSLSLSVVHSPPVDDVHSPLVVHHMQTSCEADQVFSILCSTVPDGR